MKKFISDLFDLFVPLMHPKNSAIGLLLNTLQFVITDREAKFFEEKNARKFSYLHLNYAAAYYSKLEREIKNKSQSPWKAKRIHKSHGQPIYDRQPTKRADNEIPEFWANVIISFGTALLIGLVALMLSGLLYAAHLLLIELVENWQEYTPVIVLIIFSYLSLRLIINHLVDSKPNFVKVLAGGATPFHLFSHQELSLESIREKRYLILAMARHSKENGNSGSLNINSIDTKEPAKAGVTEMVLSVDQSALEDIRDHLKRVRRFHILVGSLSFFSFIALLLIVVSAVLFTDASVFKTLFGGAGIGGVLGAFSFGQLREARTAQIALAIFQSLAVELQVNLKEANEIEDLAERRDFRAESWTNFRIGLNELWKNENRLRATKVDEEEK